MQPVLAAMQDILLAGALGRVVMHSAGAATQMASLARLGRRLLWGLLLAQLIFLFNGAYLMAEPAWPQWLDAVWITVRHTAFGATVGLSVLLTACWLLAERIMAMGSSMAVRTAGTTGGAPTHQAAILVAAVFLLALTYCRAATGHAADQGPLSRAAGVHAIHILAAGLWTGPVWVVLLLRPGWHDLTLAQVRVQARRLSHAATIGVPVLVLTGALDAWRTLGPAEHWDSTSYVWILSGKIGLMALAIVLGLRNRWYWMPRLAAGDTRACGGFFGVLVIEACVLLGVMLLAGMLGQAMLPA